MQIAQLNQLFQLLHLAHIYGHCFYLGNELKCKQWRQQRFAYRIQVLLCKTEFVKKSALFHMIDKKNTIDSNACGLTYFYGSANSRAKKGL